MKKINKSTLITIVLLIVVALSYFFIHPFNTWVKQVFFLMSMVDVDVIVGYVKSFGIWAPVISFLLMIFQSLIAPLPAFIITFANAAVFGWLGGALLSWSSAMAGAVLCFFIARFLGRDVVEKLTTKFALDSVDIFFKRYGKFAILIARLLPFVSFDVVSYAAGITNIEFWPFFVATGIGQLPATLVYSYVGGMLVGSVKTFVFALLVIFALSVLIYMMKTIWNEKNKNFKNQH
jgi:uncharacterized membrane protein YdjX (TVP38/TMEM64 family)